MAKLYAEIDSDKHGRKSSKGGDTFLRVEVKRGNDVLGTLGVYEVETVPAAYRVIWHPFKTAKPAFIIHNSVVLEDTEQKGTQQSA